MPAGSRTNNFLREDAVANHGALVDADIRAARIVAPYGDDATSRLVRCVGQQLLQYIGCWQGEMRPPQDARASRGVRSIGSLKLSPRGEYTTKGVAMPARTKHGSSPLCRWCPRHSSPWRCTCRRAHSSCRCPRFQRRSRLPSPAPEARMLLWRRHDTKTERDETLARESVTVELTCPYWATLARTEEVTAELAVKELWYRRTAMLLSKAAA